MLVVLGILFFHIDVNSQQNTKSGGICIRVDNNPSIEKLDQFYALFHKYQKKFCLGISSWSLPANPQYVNNLKYYSSQGHEVLDNTPTHQTQFFSLLNIQDTSLYANDWGVDHFFGQQVCLKYAAIDTTHNNNEGLLNISGNLVISLANGEFGDLNKTPYYFSIYFRYLDKPFLWYDLKNINPFDPDTLKIKSFWGEPVDLGNQNNIRYHKLTQRDVYLNPYSIRLLGKESLRLYSKVNIPRPYSWVHPDGPMPWINAFDLKGNMGDSLGFRSGSSPVNQGFFCYNEYNPSKIKQFSIPTGDISIEKYSFEWNKNHIANYLAKHFVKVDLSYFSEDPVEWNTYLLRLDSLLKWCYNKNIPVLTYKQWSSILYDSIPDRLVNIFPKLNTDLDDNGFPDGFDQNSTINGSYSTKDGVSESGNCCFQLQGVGNICQVSMLGGIEKGKNKFSIWVKRTTIESGNIEVIVSFPETGDSRTLIIPVDSVFWVKNTQLIDIPESVSLINLLIGNPQQTGDTIKVSGMDFRSSGFLKETIVPQQVKTANEPFQSIQLDSLVESSVYDPSSITWTIKGQNALNLSILQGNILKIQKPVSFWTGGDSTYLIARSPDGFYDSCFMKFISLPIPVACAGASIQLSLLDTLSNDIIQWSSTPYDSSISNRTIYNPVVSPKVTTMYHIICINPLGNINKDSVEVVRFVNPDPGLPADTGMCLGDSIRLTATGGVHYSWSTGDTIASIFVKPSSTAYFSVWVTTEIGCIVKDSTKVNVTVKPSVQVHGLMPSYCSNDYGATIYGLPPGGTLAATSGLVGNIFTPSLADTGINKVWYTYTNQYGCSNTDTVTVRVIQQPVIMALPDTSLCGGRSIVLHAGSGFDNYQWTNGAIDSITTVDSAGHGLGLYKITVYVTKDGCASKSTAKIRFIVCPGISETEQSGVFLLFPNPATDQIIIKNKELLESSWILKLFDPTGLLLMEQEFRDSMITLDISLLPSGFYILQMSSGGKMTVCKLMKR
ncbi:MAG: T9SS type A sorting domain-containing protein [Bacteroidales bacterium]|nr:T9SS type A sorting domain-containing protein [Bacteroidales bacterium]